GEASIFVEVTPERIFEYQTATQVIRCDDQPVRLFPRAWDFATARFRPIVSTPPAPAATKLVARRADPALPHGRPLGGFHFVSASTTLGAGADARALASPTGLDDGDPKTVWAEGLGGDGRGEFLTARTTGAAGARVRGLRLVPGDASSPAAWKAHNRIKGLSIALGAEPERRFEVEFPQDPAAVAGAAPGDPYWIALPAPVPTACVTVVIRDVYRGGEAGPRSGGGTTAISDLEVFTDLDDGDGVPRLIADAAARPDCAGRVPTLVGLGASAVKPLTEGLRAATAAGAPGRACLVQALAQIEATREDTAALEALARALGGLSAPEEQAVTAAFKKAPHPPVPALAEALGARAAGAADRARAARILGELDAEDAARALLAAVGEGSPDMRLEIVQALGRAPRASVQLIEQAMSRPPATPSGPSASAGAAPAITGGGNPSAARDADLVRVLASLARRSEAESSAALAVLRGVLGEPARPFEVRARAVMALGAVGGDRAVGDLAPIATRADDPVIRALAVRELAGIDGDPAATGALREALRDRDPQVREAAAEGLGARRDAAAEPLLIAGAKQEEWPLVRRAEIGALGQLCGAAGRDLLIRAIERDVDDVRRVALVGLARCRDRRARPALIQVMRTRRVNPSLRELAAGLLGETRDPVATQALARALPSLVNEAEGDLAVEGIATAALRALGRQGGPEAVKAAADLSRDERHPYRQTAIEVLGQLCDPGVGAAALAAARASSTPALVQAAAAAETRCRAEARSTTPPLP
ncbi:MAG TPA: HEAT repeat domain-containing protein, partial [Polyangia bacterium]